MLVFILFVFFFFKQKTAYEMRISDWSSDVCSSDLIREAYPDVLSISGPQDYASVMSAVHTALPPKRNKFIDIVPDTGVNLTPKHHAYLKISEGCNHRCSFCITPSMRGNVMSRPVEVALLVDESPVMGGGRGLLVTAQDAGCEGCDMKVD